MSLDVQNLTRRFGRVVALDGASLDAAPGEILALLGPSGCGKTTTLRIIAGFETADSGQVFLAGENLARRPPHARNIGLVFQDYALFPHMTVADNVAYGLRRRGIGRAARTARVGEMLDLVRMAGLEGRRPAQLSGGQQQRVALARALAIAPKLLLLDEPLSNLDAKLRGALQRELRDILTRVGTTTLIVTHDQNEAMALADRIAIMAGGRVLQVGTPRDVYEWPANRFVAEFLGRSLWLEGRLEGALFVTAGGVEVPVRPPLRVAPQYGLLLRPEALFLRPPLPHEGTLRARVQAARFHGSATQLDLDVVGGHAVTIDLPNRAPVPEPGTLVSVAFSPVDARVVPQQDV